MDTTGRRLNLSKLLALHIAIFFLSFVLRALALDALMDYEITSTCLFIYLERYLRFERAKRISTCMPIEGILP